MVSPTDLDLTKLVSHADMPISTKAWSSYTKADYTPAQWHAACLIHQHNGSPTAMYQCKLPVRTPNGILNKNGVIAAAAALAGARGGVNASDEEKTAAKKALVRFYGQMNMDLPDSLVQGDLLNGFDLSQKVDELADVLQAKIKTPSGPTIQDIIDGMSDEQKNLSDLIVGAAVEDGILPTDMGFGDIYDQMTDDQRNVIHFIVGAALSDAFPLEHSDLVNDILSHHGTKGMKWGVRKDSSGGSSLSKSSDGLSKETRNAARAKVKAGTATLGEAHLASIKSTGHRVTNAVLGDKTYWKRAGIIAGVTGVGIGASFAAPALLPAGILAHAAGLSGIAGVSAAGSASHVGAAVILHLGLASAYIGNQVAGGVNSVNSIVRAVKGNKRVSESYNKLGSSVKANQRSGNEATRKTLNQSGSIAKKHLRQDDIPGISMDQKVSDMDALQFGRMGMKWGVRRSRGSDGKVIGGTTAADIQSIMDTRRKIASNKGSIHGISTEDLRKLTDRINLENNYNQAILNRKTKLDVAHAKIRKGLDLGQTANKAISFGGSNAGQLLLSGISPRFASKAYHASRVTKNFEDLQRALDPNAKKKKKNSKKGP